MSQVLETQHVYLSPEEYLAQERLSEIRHEYVAGAIFAMPDASRAHSRITSTIVAALHNQLKQKRGVPFMIQRLLRIQRSGGSFYYYPDVGVDCSGSREDQVDEPTVLFEVLSPATDRIDRGEKLVNYLAIPSMRVYVLVDQFREAVTVYRRMEEDQWAMEFLGDPVSTLELPEIECSLPLATIYERVF